MIDIYFFLVKRAGRHFGFFKRAGRHEKGAGRRALQKKHGQNTAIYAHLLFNRIYLWNFSSAVLCMGSYSSSNGLRSEGHDARSRRKTRASSRTMTLSTPCSSHNRFDTK